MPDPDPVTPGQPAKAVKPTRLSAVIRKAGYALRGLDLYGVQRAERKRRPAMKHLWWYGFLTSSSGAFYFSFISLFALAMGATRTQVGWLSSAASLMGALGPMLGAALVRRTGKRKAIVVIFSLGMRLMLFFAALVPFFFTGQPAVTMLIVFFALRLGMMTVMNPAFMSMMGELVPLKLRGRYLSRRNMAMAAGSLVFVPLAGWLIERIGEPLGYQVSIGIAVVLGVLGIWRYAQVEEPEPVMQDHERKAGDSLTKVFFGNKALMGFLLIRFLWNFSQQIGGPYFTVYHREELNASLQLIGILSTVASLSGLIGQNFWGRVMDKRGTRWVFVVVNLFIPFLPFIWILATRAWHVGFVHLPGGFLMAGFNLAAVNLMLTLPKAENRPQATALHSMALHSANIIGPLVGDLVITWLGYKWAFAISGFGRFISAILFLLVLKPFTFRDMGKAVVSSAGRLRGGLRQGLGLGMGQAIMDGTSAALDDDETDTLTTKA